MKLRLARERKVKEENFVVSKRKTRNAIVKLQVCVFHRSLLSEQLELRLLLKSMCLYCMEMNKRDLLYQNKYAYDNRAERATKRTKSRH